MDLTGAIDVLVPTIHAHAGAADLKEYEDTIPIHRLQFPHNKFAIVLADVQTLTFHLIELNQSDRGDCADMRNTVCRRTSACSLRDCASLKTTRMTGTKLA